MAITNISTLSRILLAVVLLGALPSSLVRGQNQQSEDPGLREFENFVRVQMERDRIPGLTIGFLKDDQTWVKAFGYADVENKDTSDGELRIPHRFNDKDDNRNRHRATGRTRQDQSRRRNSNLSA